MAERFDAVVIGAGQAGVPLAKAMAEKGWKTALVEGKWIGGTCVNTGCTPTKTMVGSARVAYQARRGADFGVQTGEISVDLKKVRERKDAIVLKSRAGNEKRLRDAGVEILFGEARFTGPKSLAVTMTDGSAERTLEAGTIVINTGARATIPDVDGLSDIPYLTNETIMELDEVPSKLVVLGASYIALEFGQMFRRFGAEVTVIERGERFLPKEDMDVEEELLKILREDGIEVLLCGKAKCSHEKDGGVALELDVHGQTKKVSGSHLLVATGRTPNTDKLDLHTAGVKQDERGYVSVNELLETNIAGVYALGDVNGGPAFTHVSYDDFRILRANLLNGGDGAGGNVSTTGRETIYTMFTDPELGRVGMNEQEARKAGRKIKVAKVPMDWMARANEQGDPRGVLKAVVDAETDLILGASMLGVDGGELAAMIQIAMMGGLKYQVLREGVWAHPTKSEVLNTLFGNFVEDKS